MSNLPITRLILRTSDLENSTGSVNAMYSDFTWQNIDLQKVLGSTYQKYDLFNLALVSIASDMVGSAVGTSNGQLTCCLNISGLPFINCTYDVDSKTNNNHALLTIIPFVRNVNTFIQYLGTNVLTFSKNQNVVNLRMFYTQVGATNAVSVSANPYPNMVFTFNIYGIENKKRRAD